MTRAVWMFVLIFLFSGLTACNKDKTGQVPNVPVNLELYTTNPEYANLMFEGGWEYLTGGSLGLIVYRASSETFKVYDRHSPYDVQAYCTLSVDSSNIIVEDTCSGSAFLLFDGSVANGPATRPMKEYFTDFDGQILRITN